jgi:hypothetical protein
LADLVVFLEALGVGAGDGLHLELLLDESLPALDGLDTNESTLVAQDLETFA